MGLLKKIGGFTPISQLQTFFEITVLKKLTLTTKGMIQYLELCDSIFQIEERSGQLDFIYRTVAANFGVMKGWFSNPEDLGTWVTRIIRNEFGLNSKWKLPPFTDFARISEPFYRDSLLAQRPDSGLSLGSSVGSLGSLAGLAGALPVDSQSATSPATAKIKAAEDLYLVLLQIAQTHNIPQECLEQAVWPTLYAADDEGVFVSNMFSYLADGVVDAILKPDTDGGISESDLVKSKNVLLLFLLLLDRGVPITEELIQAGLRSRHGSNQKLFEHMDFPVIYYTSLASEPDHRDVFVGQIWPQLVAPPSPVPLMPTSGSPRVTSRFTAPTRPAARRIGFDSTRPTRINYETYRFQTIALEEDDLDLSVFQIWTLYSIDVPFLAGAKHIGLPNGGNECFANATFQLMAAEVNIQRLLELTPRQLVPVPAGSAHNPDVVAAIAEERKHAFGILQGLIRFLCYINSGDIAHLDAVLPDNMRAQPVVEKARCAKRILMAAATRFQEPIRQDFTNYGQHCASEFWTFLSSVAGAENTTAVESVVSGIKFNTESGHEAFHRRAPKESVKAEPVGMISLGTGITNAQDGVTAYFAEEQLGDENRLRVDGYPAVYTRKKLSLPVAPALLFVNPRKFAYDPRTGQQLQRRVEANEGILVAEERHGQPPRMVRYSLVGAILHAGSTPNSGHYISYCRTSDGQYNYLDDSTSEKMPTLDAVKAQTRGFFPYLLTYQRVS